jgi:hypothetical protein
MNSPREYFTTYDSISRLHETQNLNVEHSNVHLQPLCAICCHILGICH